MRLVRRATKCSDRRRDLSGGAGGWLLLLTAAMPIGAVAQAGTKEVVKDGYAIHQTADLGGHIAQVRGSGSMYDTLVNIHSGPRVLGETFTMHAVEGSKHFLFDSLSATSAGFGGDPINFGMLNVSKGKLYDFQGQFRRDRQYFDYNLLGNPLVPAGLVSNGYTFPQVTDSVHLFNTVRRMTDLTLTLFPVSPVHLRFGYSQNLAEGPSYSSVHEGIEGLLLQNWRSNTDTFVAGLDWKVLPKTILTYEENVAHYKGDTNWTLAGLNLRLANGAPVSLGYDIVSLPANSSATGPCGSKGPILDNTTAPPTANPCDSGYLQYTRTAPTRTLLPTEEFRFVSSSVKKIEMNGRLSYTGANMNYPNFNEYFNGLGRSGLRIQTITGNSTARRVNVAGDFGAVLQLDDRFSLIEQYDFSYYRQPGFNTLTTVTQSTTTAQASMLNAPTLTTTATAPANYYLGQKTQTNTFTLGYEASSRASLSLGYRYRGRTIQDTPGGSPFTVYIIENGGTLGVALRPTSNLRINGNVEVFYANNAFTQLSPRATQHYRVRAVYRPKPWATLSGAYNDLERRDNVQYVNHLDHSRSISFGASLAPDPRYSIDFNYARTDTYAKTNVCYVFTPAPAGAVPIPAGTQCGTNIYLGNSNYDDPTQFGSIAVTVTPVKLVQASVGYRMSAVGGMTTFLNPAQVPGSLDSQYQSPYARLGVTPHPGWVWTGEWNYYGYGEQSAVGPTTPRDFHSNVVTIGMHYEF